MAKPDKLALLDCCEKGFLVSCEGGDRALYKVFDFAERLPRPLVSTCTLQSESESGVDISHKVGWNYKLYILYSLANQMVLLDQILSSWPLPLSLKLFGMKCSYHLWKGWFPST